MRLIWPVRTRTRVCAVHIGRVLSWHISVIWAEPAAKLVLCMAF